MQWHLFELPAVAGRVLLNRVCPSDFPSFRLGILLEFVSLVFSEFWHVLETHMKFCATELDFLEKKIFGPKNWENGPKIDQKQGFFNVLKKLVITFY